MHQDRSAVAAQRVGVGRGPDQRRPIAEVRGGVAQGRQHQVEFLAVEAAAAQGGVGFDEQDRAACVLPTVDVWPELVGEQPQRGARLRHGHDRRPAMKTSGVHYAPLSMEQVFRAPIHRYG